MTGGAGAKRTSVGLAGFATLRVSATLPVSTLRGLSGLETEGTGTGATTDEVAGAGLVAATAFGTDADGAVASTPACRARAHHTPPNESTNPSPTPAPTIRALDRRPAFCGRSVLVQMASVMGVLPCAEAGASGSVET